ncbi:MAG: hypothetical protein JST93_34995 [Acidobacteria bacterium]|nr:hypothetical protein [Acidobacteriota bacterium]
MSKSSQLRRPLHPQLDQVAARVSEFARQLRAEFADLIREDAHGFKVAVVRHVQHELPPHAGRPTSPHLDRAAALRAKGLTWREVCRFINPEFHAYERYRQQHFMESVRKALAARKRRPALQPTIAD